MLTPEGQTTRARDLVFLARRFYVRRIRNDILYLLMYIPFRPQVEERVLLRLPQPHSGVNDLDHPPRLR